jgi:hypothetical protein
VLTAAAKLAESTADRRDVQSARADALSRAGEYAELKALYARWAQADDNCLRMEGQRRGQLLASLSPPPK